VYTGFYFEMLSCHGLFHSSAGLGQAVIDHLKREPDKPVSPSKEVLEHTGMAMADLRKLLKTQWMPEKQRHGLHSNQSNLPSHLGSLTIDEITLMNILILAVTARATNDATAHEVHSKNLAALIRARGGLSNISGLDVTVRCAILQWESFWALNTGSTIFSDDRPEYEPVYPGIHARNTEPLKSTLATMPEGFRSFALEGRLALDVLEVLSRTVDAQLQHLSRPNHAIVTEAEVFRPGPGRYQDFWTACGCLGVPDDVYFDKQGKVLLLPNLERIVVLGLLMYCFHTFSRERAVTAFYNGSRAKLDSDLTRRIRRTSASRRYLPHLPVRPGSKGFEFDRTDEDEAALIELEEDVLLWAYFDLVDSWRNFLSDKLLPQGIQAMQGIRIRFPQRTRSWEHCEEILKLFFWTKAFVLRCRGYWLESELMRLEEQQVDYG
jgi:hypothetical protein